MKNACREVRGQRDGFIQRVGVSDWAWPNAAAMASGAKQPSEIRDLRSGRQARVG